MSVELTQERLKELLSYEPDTGIFRWRKPPRKGLHAGDVAGYKRKDGYRQIGIAGKYYLCHRLAWLYQYGSFPENGIDHINGLRGANWIHNLRLAKSQTEQSQNVSLRNNNTSGYPGVHFHPGTGKWRAGITAKGQKHDLGLFDTPKEAGFAYREAKARLHTFCSKVRGFSYPGENQ